MLLPCFSRSFSGEGSFFDNHTVPVPSRAHGSRVQVSTIGSFLVMAGGLDELMSHNFIERSAFSNHISIVAFGTAGTIKI